MFEKLSATETRYEDINNMLSDPEVISDQQKYRDLMREHKSLTPIVEEYRRYVGAKNGMEEAKELLDAGGLEPDFRTMVEQEFSENQQKLEEYSDNLKVLLLPRDPNDDRGVIVEIRGGAGGDEAALFAGSLYRMYGMYAESMNWKSEVLGVSETELGGYKEVSFSIEGEGAYSKLKYESGVHRVQRVPETETQGRIHTSTVTVAVLPEAEEVELEISTSDLQIDTYRASGAGGQHVNKTESAIRITHLPTGTVVECQDERSQHKNRDKALKVLRARLYERALQEQTDQIASERRSQVGTGDRSERIRTYNFPQGRVTDHRIGLTLYKLEAVMNGDLTEMVEALCTYDQTEKLRIQSEGGM